MNEQLKKEYYNASTGFLGFDKFYKKVKLKYPTLTRQQIKDFYDSQEIVQVTKPVQKLTNHKITALPNNYQMDVTFFNKVFRSNQYLTLIEINSRKAFMYPLPNLKDTTIIDTLKGFPHPLFSLECDNQFNTKRINKYCDDNNIHLFSTISEKNHLTSQ